MQEKDRDPVIAICLLAALADGGRSPEERAQFTRIAQRLGVSDASELVAKVERREITTAAAMAQLSTAEARHLAYEMAVSVVYADGDAAESERAFLAELLREAGVEGDAPGALHQEAQALALAPLAGPLPASSLASSTGPRASQAGIPAMSHDQALDEMIRRQALLTGALELLPQNLASLAIIPLQMRLVYRIGQDYGQKLDGPQIKDLLGAMGIGAASQVLDGMARRILGGLGRGMFGRVLGGMVGGAAGLAAGAGVSFVSTYALGHAAKQYYAQGRALSGEDLRALFKRFKGEAEALLPKVQEQIHQQSQHLDLGKLLESIRGAPSTA